MNTDCALADKHISQSIALVSTMVSFDLLDFLLLWKIIVMKLNQFYFHFWCLIAFSALIHGTMQECLSEESSNGIPVVWPTTYNGTLAASEPQCFGVNETRITRYCNNTEWIPSITEMEACITVEHDFDLNDCPPGYNKIASNKTDYCFQVIDPTSWDYPCFTSGGTFVITDLEETELVSLTTSLKQIGTKYWLPGQRQKRYNPVIWSVPGQNWGRPVIGHSKLMFRESIFFNCLVLDLARNVLATEPCDNIYPTVCIYVNVARFPAKCPPGYFAFRFVPDKDSCFGIEHSISSRGDTFEEFITHQCPNPVGGYEVGNLGWFTFIKLAELSQLSSNHRCWYRSSFYYNGTHFNKENYYQSNSTGAKAVYLEGTINGSGTLGLRNVFTKLPCMACEKNSSCGNTELSFEYNTVQQKMYLTIYFPLGLWKDEVRDKGIRCFSDAKGFVKVIDFNDTPYFEANHTFTKAEKSNETAKETVTKVVYQIDPVTDRSAQYWCEGHSKNFTLLRTDVIVVNPSGEYEHVFVLVIKTTNDFMDSGEDFPSMVQLIETVTDLFDAEKVLLMDILDMKEDVFIVLLHLHVHLGQKINNFSDLIVNMYDTLVNEATHNFDKHNYTFINMTSSTHCLPTTSPDIITLNWELTPIGHISAPKQFCLQSNGLPVTRRCGGSYTTGAVWQPVDGQCSANYEASNTTAFLYNVAKGHIPINNTAHFLTNGLGFVFDDLGIIIPADIFYLSMSFQYILKVAEYNDTWIDMGDIYNIAWVMDKVMVLDWDYLRLAQSLNSTNVILDSINGIIDIIATRNKLNGTTSDKYINELAVEPNFVVQISYPLFNNITGLALIRDTDSNNFTDMTIFPLYSYTVIEDILKLENLEVAAWVPEEVLRTIRLNKNESQSNYPENDTISREELHVVLSIFNNDAIFQELDYAPHNINSRIIGISIPDYISNLEYPVTLVFKEFHQTGAPKSCGYWDFNTNSHGTVPGFWAKDGCYLADSPDNLTICQCFHLTHFGQLISRNRAKGEDMVVNVFHDRALNVITLVGCFLSLLGIVGIWITAILFHTWRQKPGTKVLIQLSTAISMPLILMLISNLELGLFEINNNFLEVAKSKENICIAFGAILHFSILTGFTWMLITAILQFIRYVLVLGVHRPARFMCKLALVGWGVPLIPVSITLLADRKSYIPAPIPAEAVTVSPLCYPAGLSFYLGVLLPIASVLLINITLFVLVMYSISRGPDGKFRNADMDLIGAQLRLSIFLFFLLGLTWIFGFLSFWKNAVMLSYLFCLTSTLQGFVLFIYFIICDPATRILWVSLMRPQFRTSLTSSTSIN